MINLIKADGYRMLHQKSFYITGAILVAFYFMILCSDGGVSNMPFAQFSRDTDTIMDFLYYFPKSSVFIAGSLIYGALFTSESYTSRMSASIYPLQQHKWIILLAQWGISLVIYLSFTIVVVLMALLSSLWVGNGFGSVSLLDYVIYLAEQTVLFASMMACVGVITHAFRNTTLSIIFGIFLGSSLLFMLMGMVLDRLHLDPEWLRFTLTYAMGNLPYLFSWEGCLQPLLVGLCFTGGCFIISNALLHSRDLV